MKYLTLFTLTLFLFGNQFHVQSQDAKFQALIMYNFTKLLEWPDKSGDFVINVIGNAELSKELKEYTANKKVAGLQVIVVQKMLLSELSDCQMVFVGSSETSHLSKIINKVGNKNTLIVTEKNNLTNQGASISFIKTNDTWKFEFNESNIKKSGLKVSSDFRELGIAR